MDISRRQLVALGATGAAGAMVGKVAIGGSASAADQRTGGIHINVFTKTVKPAAGVPHHWTLTVYGPDNDLSGMGWGGALDVKTGEDIANAQMTQCIYSLRGSVQGNIVKLHGLMLFAADRGVQGQAMSHEANLATGFYRVSIPMADGPFVFEGKGSVLRI